MVRSSVTFSCRVMVGSLRNATSPTALPSSARPMGDDIVLPAGGQVGDAMAGDPHVHHIRRAHGIGRQQVVANALDIAEAHMVGILVALAIGNAVADEKQLRLGGEGDGHNVSLTDVPAPARTGKSPDEPIEWPPHG